MSKTNILLESGTNELEVLLFELPGAVYGVNVAKVREVILPTTPPTPLPHSKPAILGMLNLRGKVVPIISLRQYFNMPPADPAHEQRIIVMEFSGIQSGFVVDHVDKIYRISWSQLSPVPEEAISNEAAFTAFAKIQEKIVLLVDFERIMIELTEQELESAQKAVEFSQQRSQFNVLVADDSSIMRRLIQKHLEDAGYRVASVSDGKQAWEKLCNEPTSFNLVVSDIEMPGIDGLHLTKKIRESQKFSRLPVVLFSSLITPDNYKKGQVVGANEQISKPDMNRIPQIADQLLLGQ